MLISSLGELEPVEERAVLINCGTKLVSTLALLGVLERAGVPALMIDCESRDGSFEHFQRMMKKYPFDLMKAPLQIHGLTLDRLFRETRDRRLLLVDSDLEINDPWSLRFMRDYIEAPSVFGAGFQNGPGWLTDHDGTFLEGAFYQERPWMPLVLLNVEPVREALERGLSFRDACILNDFPIQRVAKLFMDIRVRYPSLRKREAPRLLRFFRKAHYGQRPALVMCDTGALVYQYLKYERSYAFVSLPSMFQSRYVTHFGGVTRVSMDPKGQRGHHITGSPEHIEPLVRERLAKYAGAGDLGL